jgi:hypothetical protein
MANVSAPETITAISHLLWPILVGILLVAILPLVRRLMERASEIAIEGSGFKLSIRPSRVLKHAGPGPQPKLSGIGDEKALPADYIFINHTSFLRPEMQIEFQKRTGVQEPHYDIRVVVDSYYRGALDRIDRVEYILHEAYPDPIQVRTDRENRFLLKEVANGEYVLVAKVYLNDKKTPLILQRYISLWKDGPRI